MIGGSKSEVFFKAECFKPTQPYTLLEGSYPSRRAGERLKAYIEAVSARKKANVSVLDQRSLQTVSEHSEALFNAAETT